MSQVITDPKELARLQRINNPNNKPTGHFTGRCMKCGSKDLWDDATAYGCNCCGATYFVGDLQPQIVENGTGRVVGQDFGGVTTASSTKVQDPCPWCGHSLADCHNDAGAGIFGYSGVVRCYASVPAETMSERLRQNPPPRSVQQQWEAGNCGCLYDGPGVTRYD